MSKLSKLEGAVKKVGDAAMASADSRFDAVDSLLGKAAAPVSVEMKSTHPISSDMVSSELVSKQDPKPDFPEVGAAKAFTSTDTASSDIKSYDTKSFPWQDANAKVKVAFQLRLPESLHMKLKWLSEQGRDSIHEIALRGVEVEVDKLLEKHANK